MFLLAIRSYASQSPLAAFEADLRAGIETSCLLTPTATMAEHVRHTFARRGLFVRPDSIVTLSRFVQPLVKDIEAASTALLDRLVAKVLAEDPPAVYAPLVHAKGLRRTLVHLLEEVSTASRGQFPEGRLRPAAEAFRTLYYQVERELIEREKIPRAARLRVAAARLRQTGHPWRRVYLHGFHAFTPAELQILEALDPASIELTLPAWEGAIESRRELIAMGFEETPMHVAPSQAITTLVTSNSEWHEAEEIARRILLLVEQGREFRQIGILLRREHPYGPLLRTTLGRFGIPARYYFPRTLDTHPVSRFFFGLLDAILANWEYETLLPLIRMHYSGIAPSPEADRIDHALRERMPARGFPGELAALASWQALEHWRTASFTPAEWAGQLKQLRTLIRLPAITDQVPHEQVLEWRELLSALDAWDEALRQTAALGDDAPASLVEFRMQLAEVASHVAISDKDQRRNVVHVLDVYEARQWSLPVVFVCGLLERAFPQYHSEHPILTDEDRETLRAQRVVLRTSSERQREEVVLFENAVQCATEELILSYPRTNSKGEETLPSFFLNRLSRSRPLLQETTVACRPQPRWPAAPLPSSSITAKQALAMLRKAATTLSPTAIETYLQCPFQFLARSVLRVNTPPVAPLDRLDFLLQGSIIHDTLAATEGSPLFVEEIFSRLFDDACQKKSLASGCRTERVRLELHNNLRRFLESPPLTGAATVGVEHGFKLKLNDDLRISGKMDRVAQLPDRGLVVIDYKYSSRARVRDRVRSHDRGELVQGGLYLWAAEKLYKQNLAGMLYCGLRGEVTWAGWHIPAFGWDEIGESTDAIRLREIIDGALESSIAVAQRIAAGDIAPAPADRKKCDWCEYRDTCRIELEAAPALVQLVSGGGE